MKKMFGKVVHVVVNFFRQLSPVQTITLGYALYILVIFLLLCLPFTWKIGRIGWLDHLFMATSAVSTTGLVTINTPDGYNFWGQLILLCGIQLGGLGYMTLGSFLILASKGRVSPSRIVVGKFVFSMPNEFEPIAFIRRAVIFTLSIEVLGALALYIAFWKAGLPSPSWPAIFHSVSSFCTAGFSVFPNSLESYRANISINVIIAMLSILGAIGFIVMSDVWLKCRSRTHTLTLTSKIILVATFGGIVVGTLALLMDTSMARLPLFERVLTAFFQSMTAITTVGFNTHSIGDISQASVWVLVILMLLGASPSGTGGGLKSTTWSAALATTWSAVRGRTEITFFGYVVPYYRIQAAFASFALYLVIFGVGCFILLLVEKHKFEDIIFEAASALGTVGLSRGMTNNLTDIGKLVLIGLMFVGRVGVVSLGLAALSRKEEVNGLTKEGDFVI